MEAFVYDIVRTPRGRGSQRGALAGVAPHALVAGLLDEIGNRFPEAPAAVEDVTLGCNTVTGEQGGDLARAAALYAGWPDDASGAVVSRLCCSGVDALATSAAKVAAGQHSVVAAGGVESMSRVPIFSDNAPLFADPELARRAGFVHMGVAADLLAAIGELSRADCDAYALRSHQRAAAARDEGRFAGSLVSVTDDDGAPLLDRDEMIRDDQTLEALRELPAAFGELADERARAVIHERLPDAPDFEAVHSAATAPQMVDAASLALIGSRNEARRLGRPARAQIAGCGSAGVRSPLLSATVPAAQRALSQAGMTFEDVDLFEINESFAATPLHFERATGVDPERVNVNGGAIAMGHPLGATGAILAATLLDELERRDLETGLVAIPAAAGIGAALVLQRV